LPLSVATFSLEQGPLTKMIQTIKQTIETIASFTLILLMLSLHARCFFAHAEIQYGSELSSMLGSAQLQALSELVVVLSSVSLLVLSFLYFIVSLVVRAGVVVLCLVSFCAGSVAEIAVRATKGLCFVNRPFRRFVARCFTLLIENSCRYVDAVEDANRLKFPGLLEAQSLKMIVFRVAPVLAATAKQSASKRDRRVVSRVSFVFIVLLVLIGVIGTFWSVVWLRFSAVGWLLVAAELLRSSAATEGMCSALVNVLKTPSCCCLNVTRSLFAALRKIAVPNKFFRRNTKKSARRRVRFASKTKNKLESFVFVEKRACLNEEELRERFWSNAVLKKMVQESADERDFEIFQSHDFFDRDLFFLFSSQASVMLTEEVFFLDHEGERRHPAHWRDFCTRVRPFLPMDREVPGFSSVNEYDKYLQFYDKLYRTCITWYDNNLWRSSDVLVPAEEICEEADLMEEDVADGSRANCHDLALADQEVEVDAGAECEDTAMNCEVEVEVEVEVEEEDNGESLAVLAVQGGAVEELEAEGTEEVAAPLPRRVRKMKTFGPCFRSRPYLKRKCKENVRYTK
jgi:ABC-type multidrug transport system fused ATPase/permease subunit